MTTNRARLGLLLLLAGLSSPLPRAHAQEDLDALERDFRANARRAAPRDAFPVLESPALSTAADGDKALRPDDWVIGVDIGGEARAYPVAVMGLHELANDTCGGVPIAVSW